MWLVAEMIDDEGTVYNVVPEGWVKEVGDLTFILWPPSKGKNILEVIKNQVAPDDSWSEQLAVEMSPIISDFQQALGIERLAIQQKSCQKAFQIFQDAVRRKGRVRIPTKNKLPGEESTEDKNSPIASSIIPPPPSMKERTSDAFTSSSHSEPVIMLSEDLGVENGEMVSVLMDAENMENDERLEMSLARLAILERELTSIKSDVAAIKSNTDLILKLLQQGELRGDEKKGCSYTLPIQLPLLSKEQLLEMEAMLDVDEAFRKYLIRIMGEMNTKDLGQFLRRNLSKVMVNSVAANFTWLGTADKKKESLKGQKNLITVLTVSSRRKGLHEDKLFVREISNWLYQSARRKDK